MSRELLLNTFHNVVKFNNTINIGVLHEYVLCKGKEYIDNLIKIPFGKYKIEIPEKTPSGRILRIPGKGMPIYNSKNNEYGNLMVKVHANFHGLNETQLDLIKKIKELE